MECQRRVLCPENEELASFMWGKRQEMAEPKGISERIDATLYKAYCNVCNTKTPIKTLKEFSQIKGVGKWTLRLMQEFFETDSGALDPEQLTQKGKKTKAIKRYVPQKNSVAYALLITLYRGTANGSGFMRKQELIDAAEANGLSRVPIAPEKGRGKPGQFGSSPRDWYSGWSCMKTLVTKGLVVKSSCPAKYMLTEEGQLAARECLSRSGFADPIEHVTIKDGHLDQDVQDVSVMEFACSDSANEELTLLSVDLRSQKKSVDVPLEFLERFTRMGYSKEQIHIALIKVSQASQNKEMSSLWPVVLHHLRKDQACSLRSEFPQSSREDCLATSSQEDFTKRKDNRTDYSCGSAQHRQEFPCSVDSAQSSLTLRACSSWDYSINKWDCDGMATNINTLSMPPLGVGEKFEDVYEVILILDDREQFINQGSRSGKIIENIRSQFKIKIEVRRLPVGDGVWIARHKHLGSEYVLDFIVERKKVDDFRFSIRDNRYKDQKLRLLRCGLKKLIYVVEGDPNSSEAAESIKTACFTTEILEGFDILRTTSLGDTLRKYGYLTQSIYLYYRMQFPKDKIKSSAVCLSYDGFVKKCQDLEKMTVSDVFAIQLMQVPQVTEEIAVVVLDLYPTLVSLAHAYSLLEGGIYAQEEMLRKQSNNLISGVASRNIFRLVWGG